MRPKWRLQLQLLGQWRKIPEWFTHRNEVYEHFVPVLFTAMHNGPHVVAREAAAVLCVCIRKNSFDFQQRAMCQRISREFARARSWSYRLLFLDLCDQVLDMFSRRFFRAYFLDDVLMMDGDPVSNVRMKLAEMLPAVTATLPDNSVHAEKLEWMLSTMQKDQDRDVAAAARVASAAVQEAGSKSPHSQQLADDLDHRREHEENDDGKAEAAMHSMVLLQRNSSQSGGKRASGILGEHRLSRGGARAKAPSARRLVSERLSSGSHKPESSGSMGTGHGGITRSASDLGRPRAGSLVESKPKKELKGRRGSAGSRSTLSSAPNSTATSSCDSLRSLDRPIEPLVSYKTKELARGRRRNRALSTSSTPPTSIVASNTSMNTTNK